MNKYKYPEYQKKYNRGVRKLRYKQDKEFKESHRKDTLKYRRKYAIYGSINGNSRWSEEHNKMVMEHNTTDMKLAKIIGRSLNAIITQRVRLNKLKHILTTICFTYYLWEFELWMWCVCDWLV